MIMHMSLSVVGALKWPKRKLNGLFTGVHGRKLTADECRSILRGYLTNGVELLPMAECPGHDPVNGCPGHAVPAEATCPSNPDGKHRPWHDDGPFTHCRCGVEINAEAKCGTCGDTGRVVRLLPDNHPSNVWRGTGLAPTGPCPDCSGRTGAR